MGYFMLLVASWLLFLSDVSAETQFQTMTSNYKRLMDLYSINNISIKDFIPRVNFSEPMSIKLYVSLYALNDFDEVSGSLDLMVGFNMSWTDQIVAASELDASVVFNLTNQPLKYLTVPYGKIWTPNLVLMNSVEASIYAVGYGYQPRYYLDTGYVNWKPKVHVHSTCSPDVTFYPFDRQVCKFSFVPWGRTFSEINFYVTQRTWGLEQFEENGEWTIIDTSAESIARHSNTEGQPEIRLSLTIQRKPLYFAFNIIMPTLILVLLNGMVFWLPVESGERIGFSVTCFLSFVVLLNMIMDLLPRSSSPISYLCFYTATMMVFSGLSTVFVIFQMCIYHKPETEKIPWCIAGFIRVLKCKCCQRKRGPKNVLTVHPVEECVKPQLADSTTDLSGKEHKDEDAHGEITWHEVAGILDKFFFLTFSVGQIFFSICFLIPLGQNA